MTIIFVLSNVLLLDDYDLILIIEITFYVGLVAVVDSV